MKRRYLLLFLCCLPSWLYAHEALDFFLEDLHTLKAYFVQTLYDESGQQLEKSRGIMYLQRPNKFRWVYLQPYTQLIVADGKKMWVYDNELEQVTVKKLDGALGKTPAFLLSRHQAIEEDFVVNELPSRNNITRLELVPKDTQAQFDSVRINLRWKKLLSFELVDNLGQTTYIKFRKVRRNPKVAAKKFRFKPPKGVDIIQDY